MYKMILYIYIYMIGGLDLLLGKSLGYDLGAQPYLLRRCLDPLYILVGGFKHFSFSIIYGIIIPTD